MHKTEVMALLREKKWTVSALAERWGYSRRHVTARIADPDRGVLWEDALRGLPLGPGFYRQGMARLAPKGRYDLVVGSLVASEAEMETFGYGARGVVVEVLGVDRWLVVWDGGTEMEIDGPCMQEWVMDIGLEVRDAEWFRGLSPDVRRERARLLELSS